MKKTGTPIGGGFDLTAEGKVVAKRKSSRLPPPLRRGKRKSTDAVAQKNLDLTGGVVKRR